MRYHIYNMKAACPADSARSPYARTVEKVWEDVCHCEAETSDIGNVLDIRQSLFCFAVVEDRKSRLLTMLNALAEQDVQFGSSIYRNGATRRRSNSSAWARGSVRSLFHLWSWTGTVFELGCEVLRT